MEETWRWLSSGFFYLSSYLPSPLMFSHSLPKVTPPPEPTTIFFILIALLAIVVLLLLAIRGGRSLPLSRSSRILLVIAHPDDETMFFSPTLTRLTDHHKVFILCVSTGDFYGKGQIRVRELRGAVEKLGMNSGDVITLDYDVFKDGHSWDKSALSRVLLYHVESLSIDCVLSFDGGGVSSHPNHISCFEALQECYSRGELPAEVQVFCLDTVPLFRKYISLFDAPFSVVRSPFRYFARPRDVFASWRAMCEHKSQLLWFRYLFMLFSRYVLINTFRRIPPSQRIPRGKKIQ